LSWQYVIRGNHQDDVAYIYTLQPILFLVPNSSTTLLEARRKDADALRARFSDCESGLPDARMQHDVVIRKQITKKSIDLSPPLREILNKTGLGHLTPPETTSHGVQLFAVCGVRPTPSNASLFPEPLRILRA
jgi:peptidyl-prolyl cis-trans isomerase SurA